MTPIDASTSGSFARLIGRDDDGFAESPSLDVTGGATSVNALRSRKPFVMLHEGETQSVANLDHSDFRVNTYVAGFLSPVVRAPEPSSLGLAATGALLAVGSMRRRTGGPRRA